MYFLYILFAVLMFSFLIGIHELGHFVTAKLSGVRVNEFSLFMGPAIWQKQHGETLYALRTIPIGGYCAMEGEDGESDDPRAFGKAAWWKKILILVAGATMNFLAGFLLVVLMVSCTRQSGIMATTTVKDLAPGCLVGGEAGIHPGDELYAIDGERILVSSDFSYLAALNLRGEGYTHDLTVIRDGKKIVLEDFNLEPVMLPDENGEEVLRYGVNLESVPRSLGSILSESWGTTLGYVRMVRLSLTMLFTGKASMKDTMGPVGIVKTIADVGTQSASIWAGFWNVINFTALIAVNLAVMNLLPIPALDGGRVVSVALTTVIEAIIGKKLNPKIEGTIHSVGMALLLVLMAVILLKDILQILIR